MEFSTAVRLLEVLLLVHLVAVQDPNCDYLQNVPPGQTYYVYSPGYPQSYSAGVQCRWIGVCPPGYSCRIDCSEINIPQSSSCTTDKLLVSKTGDPALDFADPYCGRGSLVAVSSGQRISIGLISSRSSPGGRFMCSLTAINKCSCGNTKKRRIVGGNPTLPNEYPMMAALVRVDVAAVFCGATVVDERHLLTAAHCVTARAPSSTAAVTGMHYTTGGGNQTLRAYKISKFIIHPKYDKERKDFDIALVRLESRLQYGEDVGPVCLPFKFTSYDFTTRNVSLLGWGSLSPGGPTSSSLQKVVVPVAAQRVCQQYMPGLTKRQICTYQPGKDACQSDSGGPVMYSDPSSGRVYLVGIISYGVSCASGYPGVNTRVTAFLDWIQANTGASYCMV